MDPDIVTNDALPPRENAISAAQPRATEVQSLNQTGDSLAAQAIDAASVAPVTPQTDMAALSPPPPQTVALSASPEAQRIASAAPVSTALSAQSLTDVRLTGLQAPTIYSNAAPVETVALRPETTDLAGDTAFQPPLTSNAAPESEPPAVAAAPQPVDRTDAPSISPPASDTLAAQSPADVRLTEIQLQTTLSDAASVETVAFRSEPTDLAGETAFQPPLTSNAAPESEPQAVAAAPQPVAQTDALAISPPADRARASLAFPNTGDGAVDPVSLSAFQSFMEPGDLSGAAAEVRDGIRGTLSAIPCSRLQVQFDPVDNSLLVSGHVPDPDLRSTVVSAMQSQMGKDIPVREDLLILPRPQCGALAGIASVGLPQSTDQITNPLLVGEDTHAREFRYTAGSPLVMTLQGADYDAYVYVDYFDADGNVLHLSPNEFTPLKRTEAKSALQIGSDHVLEPGEPGLYIEIGPPFGQEIAVAFAASEPLYEGVRPLVEPAEPYLAWLRERVSEARAANPDFKGEWVYFFISTAAE
jgi:hypothetical protein